MSGGKLPRNGVNPLDMPEPLIGRVKEMTLKNPPCPITPPPLVPKSDVKQYSTTTAT